MPAEAASAVLMNCLLVIRFIPEPIAHLLFRKARQPPLARRADGVSCACIAR